MTKRELAAKGRTATLEDVKALDKEVTCLTPELVAGVMGVSAQWIRVVARGNPGQLGFPVCCLGSRVYIPVNGFIAWMEGGASCQG